MRTFYFLFAFSVLFIPIITSAQKMKKGIEYQFDMKTYIQSKNIVWYGWDFSKSKMRDINKIQDAELIQKQFIPAISERLNKRITPEMIQRKVDKELVTDLSSVQNLYLTMDYKNFITMQDYELPVDSIKTLVKNYNLPQQNGVGFVIIIEFMHKTDRSDRFVTGYVTFFDIKTRDLLWTTKMKGLPGSKYGFAMYWIEGIKELYEYFMGDYYNKSIRKAKDKFGI